MTAPSRRDDGVTRFDSTAASDPAVIETEIEATRGEMTETIDAIQDRLDPERLSAQAVTTATEVTDQARDAAKEVVQFAIEEAKTAINDLAAQATTTVRAATVGRVEEMVMQTRQSAEYAKGGLFETIKQNPVPAALAAIGIGWLWSHRAGGTARSDWTSYGGRTDWSMPPSYLGAPYYGAYGVEGQGYGQSGGGRPMTDQVVGQVQDKAGQVQEKAGEVIGQVQQGAGQVPGQVAGQVQQAAGAVGQQMQERAGQVQEQAQGFWQMLESNPVAIGALGVVLGGAAGLLIPESEQEHQLMGQARDRVLGSVQEIAGQKIEQAQRVVAEAGQAAMETGQAALRDANTQGAGGSSTGAAKSGGRGAKGRGSDATMQGSATKSGSAGASAI